MSKKYKFYRVKNKAGQYVGDVFVAEDEEKAKELAIKYNKIDPEKFDTNELLLHEITEK